MLQGVLPKSTLLPRDLSSILRRRTTASLYQRGSAIYPGEDPAYFDQQYGYLLAAIVLAFGFVVIKDTLTELSKPPVNDTVPDGDMPSLEDFLARNAPPRPDPHKRTGGKTPKKPVEDLSFEPVTNTVQLWESYTFATAQLVEEVPSMLLDGNYWGSILLQIASFPDVYDKWQAYEQCVIDEVALGPDSSTFEKVKASDAVPLTGNTKDVVLECGKMYGDHGFSLIVRPPRGDSFAGSVNMIVKRLPEACHLEGDGEECTVNCTVKWDDVEVAPGLEAVGYLEAIAVSRKWRGSGLADRMLKFVEGKARTWGLRVVALHVHRDNWGALRFYSKRGFEVTSDWMGWGDGFFLLLKPLDATYPNYSPDSS